MAEHERPGADKDRRLGRRLVGTLPGMVQDAQRLGVDLDLVVRSFLVAASTGPPMPITSDG